MEEIVAAKFTQHPDLAEKLLETGSMILIEGNDWGDTYWGAATSTEQGENHLGKILMKIRGKLREGKNG